LKIVTISDTHWKFNEIEVPECDLVLHAGDISGRGKIEEVEGFLKWFQHQPGDVKVLIAGNHDFGFESKSKECEDLCKLYGIIYLNDSGCTVQNPDTNEDIKIWGSPVQPEFMDWAFNRARTKKESRDFGNQSYSDYDYIGTHWDLIPAETDILITHGPPYDILDQCSHGQRVGCEELLNTIQIIKPKLHVFGHIHEARGVFVDNTNTITYNNASSLDLQYNPHPETNFCFDWEKVKKGNSNGRDF
jgi:predicted phosphohydrolase